MKFVRKLANPFVIAAQGFVVGAILFTATAHDRAPQVPAYPASSYELPQA